MSHIGSGERCRGAVFWPLGLALGLFIGGCGLSGSLRDVSSSTATQSGARAQSRSGESRAQDIVIFSLGLMETGYQFGGKNPEAGLDCSGMVAYVYGNAAGIRLSGSAADLARRGRRVAGEDLLPGDLVFFNTRNKPHSHVGIYIGEGRFIHAPSTSGRVRIESLTSGWFATRFEEGRTLLD